MTSREVAQLFGVGVATVRRWAVSGDLPSFLTLGGQRRFRRTDVERLLHTEETKVVTFDSPPPIQQGDIKGAVVAGHWISLEPGEDSCTDSSPPPA